MSSAKHSYAPVPDRQTDRQTQDKVILMCRYASQATQKTIFSTEVKVKVRLSLTLVSFERASLVEYECQISPNMKSLSLTVQKL